MKKIIFTVLSLIIVGALIYFGKDFLPQITSSQGKIAVQANTKVAVFINSENKGSTDTTPFSIKVNPGKYDLRLQPDNQSTTSAWQQQVTVNSGVETFVAVTLGPTDTASSWQMIILEKIKRNETELALFSQSDSSEIFLDGERKGSTPLSLNNIQSGTHELKFMAPGFAESAIKIKINPGIKHQVTMQLAKLDQQPTTTDGTPGSSTNTDTSKQAKVKILKTPTGWLRVRSEPAKTGNEFAKVNTDEEFPYIEEKDGWYKIEYEKGKEGWVSAEYAEKSE